MLVKRLVVTLLALFLLSPVAAAQDVAEPDIAAVAERLATVDSERLLMRLNTPIPVDLLPQPFSNPQPLGPALLAEQRQQFAESLDGIRGSAVYTLDYMPVSVMASPSPMQAASPVASPTARGPFAAFTSGSLAYLLFDAPVDAGQLAEFGASIQTALGSDAQAGSMEEITVHDSPAILVSSVSVVNALEFHTEWIAMPVGNVVVLAMVTEGSNTFDEERFRSDNASLAVSGVAYLERILGEMDAS